MKKLFKKLEWWFDFYVVYFLYNDRDLKQYKWFMEKKYGKTFWEPKL